MFSKKHEITLNDGVVILLYGEDYFGDKKAFWDSHQTQLKSLIAKVNLLDAPIEVVEFPDEHKLYFKDINSFKIWLSEHHPYTY